MHTPSWTVYIFDIHTSLIFCYCILIFISSQALMVEIQNYSKLLGNVVFRYVDNPFYISIIHIPKFHITWKAQLSFLVNASVAKLHSTSISKLHLYPNFYNAVVIIGLLCYSYNPGVGDNVLDVNL